MVFHRLRGFFFYFDLKKGRIFFDSIVKRKNPWWVWLLPLPIVWWAALLVAGSWSDGMSLVDLLGKLSAAMNSPFSIHWTDYSLRCLFFFSLGYGVIALVVTSNQKNRRRGEEHGSAKWGDVFQIAKKYRDKKNPKQNLILTQHFQMGMDGYRHKRNTNVLVIGGSGAGKSRSYAIPNALNCGSCSLVICDPKSEILRKTGGALKANGYEVRVFDLLNPDASFCYNPLAYVRDDKDVLRLIETLIQSTTPPGAQSTDPFWTKSETALLQALVLYLMHEAPPEEQNFAMVMEMLAAAEVREEDEEYESPLDILFARLEMRDPESIAVKQYHVFKMGAGKTLKSILISVGVRLSAFNLPQIARLTYTDDLHLEEMGEKKIALFCCIPDSDKSLNYLVGMIYGQLIQTLYFVADRKYKGRLPVPVHLLIDEAPNIALPTDNFLPWLSTMRSRNIFCSYIAQNMAQIKALFKEQWESLVGLCDEFLYLGGNEKETHKYNPAFFLLAYERIQAKPGNMTAGSDGKTIDGMSMKRIEALIQKLKDFSYQPKPARRTYIPKANGKTRPLGIPSFDDKLVQEVVRMILESIYEPTFHVTSHGFRPKRSCHTALQYIKRNYTGVKWFVEGDIKGCFDNIDHHVLVQILRRRIADEHFIGLIWKFLKAG